MSSRDRQRQERIPPSLQNVFLQSNRGKEINKPPPNSEAFKTYHNNWVHQRGFESGSSRNPRNSRPPSSTRGNESFLAGSRSKQSRPARAPPRRQRSFNGLSPQEHLDKLLGYRGYSTTTYKTLSSAYFNSPTKLQIASYGPSVVEVVRSGDVEAMRDLLESGISPNPCNLFGESLIHMVCRRGDTEMFRVMLENGSSVKVSDDFGRTPLHDACWAATPAFEIVELLLRKDPRLLYMKDRRGALPLSYVPRDFWYLWRQFIDDTADVYFPLNKARTFDEPPELCNHEPESFPIPDPSDAMPVKLVSLVASGQMSLDEAQYMVECGTDATNSTSPLDDEEYSDDDDDESSFADYSTSEMDDFDITESEDQVGSMMELVRAWG